MRFKGFFGKGQSDLSQEVKKLYMSL
ncbi:hypothetical protein PT2222_140429 [Paraburkholderia tropica]